MFAKSLSGPSTPKASVASLPPRLLRLLPAGAKVAGWGSHPLKDRAFARRTRYLIVGTSFYYGSAGRDGVAAIWAPKSTVGHRRITRNSRAPVGKAAGAGSSIGLRETNGTGHFGLVANHRGRLRGLPRPARGARCRRSTGAWSAPVDPQTHSVSVFGNRDMPQAMTLRRRQHLGDGDFEHLAVIRDEWLTPLRAA